MPVDLKTERTNIHELVIEAPALEPKIIFEPERDIPENVWRDLERVSKSNVVGKSWLAAALKIVAPHRLKDYGIVEPTRGDFDSYRGGDLTITDVLQRIAEYNIAFPGLKEKLYPYDALSLKNPLAFPTNDVWISGPKVWEAIGLDYEAVDGIRNSVDWANAIWQYSYEDEIFSKAYAAALARLIFPDTFRSIKLENKFWEEAKRTVREGRGTSPIDKASNTIGFAKNLVIIAAHRAEVTPDGLVIDLQPPAEDLQEDLKMPTERSF